MNRAVDAAVQACRAESIDELICSAVALLWVSDSPQVRYAFNPGKTTFSTEPSLPLHVADD